MTQNITNKELGSIYLPKSTTFRVWLPEATNVHLEIEQKEYLMAKNDNGIWELIIRKNLTNCKYRYKVDYNGSIEYAVDPYSKSLTSNGLYSVVIDLKSTNPDNWDNDIKPVFKTDTDAIIYEIHIRDFSIDDNSGVTTENKGKYLGFTENGTVNEFNNSTCLDHLKELGITHVHLLPIQDFATVDETKSDEYNWGYDPYHFFAPEGSYSSDSEDGIARIKEIKQLVQSLHKNGIRVIMDVVYNHNYALNNNFDKLYPKYYFRMDSNGWYANGSGCGNEFASEKPMVRRLMIDSLKYWTTEYHIDGFRFDLMALHDDETMYQIREELNKIHPSILIYGEPWTACSSALPWEKQFTKGKQRGKNIALINDEIRIAIKGSSEGAETGFISNSPFKVTDIKRAVVGSIDYEPGIQGFTEYPNETINYISNHDNYCLWDKLQLSHPYDSDETRERMYLFAHAILLTCQGIPFIHGGEEIRKTKHGNKNSYNAGDNINKICWNDKQKHLHMFNYIKGLIELRKKHPAFRMSNPEQIKKHLKFLYSPTDTVMFQLCDNANNDIWKDIVIIYNPHREIKEFALPEDGVWNIVVNDNEAGIENVKSRQGAVEGSRVYVTGISCMVVYKLY